MAVASHAGPAGRAGTASGERLRRALRPVWDSISFEKVSVQDGAKQYYDNAIAILARA